MTVKISRRPNNIRNTETNFNSFGKKAQLSVGPISPNPGPILPIAEAAVDNEVIKSIL